MRRKRRDREKDSSDSIEEKRERGDYRVQAEHRQVGPKYHIYIIKIKLNSINQIENMPCCILNM